MADNSSPPASASLSSEEKTVNAADTTPTVPAASDVASTDGAVDQETPADAAADPSTSAVDAATNPATDTADTPANGVTDSTKKKEKRKSTGGVPEHKNKKMNRKKSMANLHLDVEPGQYWYVTMKGYQAWPAIICDEQMLPESLLRMRPVSAKRVDGSYRPDFEEGGKNVRDRRYPVMFLGTNEFAWQVNTELQPLDMEELKRIVANKEQGKRNKSLWGAFEVAAEENDLDHFKEMLVEHERRVIQEQQEREEAEEAAANQREEEPPKKAKRKSTAAATEDVDMEDADAPKVKKPTKRKAAKDGEAAETENVPKKIKFKSLAEPAAKETTPKPKKAKAKATPKVEAAQATARVEETLTPQEKFDKKQKTILYLRHKLQKGFLSRDQTPKSDEMPAMSEHLTQLEAHTDLEPAIIKATKINKVLKGMVRLASIPREEEFTFKQRSESLLATWNKVLASDGDATPAAEPATNGVSHDEKATPIEVPAVELPKAAEAKAEESESKSNGDVEMEDAPVVKEPATAAQAA
ncbi:hypothetical protein EJ08DRAFT_692439 [Tothia fuscella]|uniref:PWWP domain-containing protein n=1 Tax=Tothia fuscella TaxID=1048955 RepID=A0A9P4P0C7_9PEZI|nr:hypothetical protein EJ08DRAFT_692439 [Tothia fuscella]